MFLAAGSQPSEQLDRLGGEDAEDIEDVAVYCFC
jgi:hypothetical protein